MKCNPFVSTPIAVGLFALAASQVFSTIGKLADAAGPSAAEQSPAIMDAQNVPAPARMRADNGVGRAISVQHVRIVDQEGNPVILLSGTPEGAAIEMRTPDGERVMLMQSHKTGAFRQTVLSGGEPVAQFATAQDRGTDFMLASPGRHSSVAGNLRTMASTLVAFNTLRMDGRAGLYQWFSLSGATIDGRDYLPGHLISTVHDRGTRTWYELPEHLLFSAEELEAAMVEVLPDDQ